MNFIIIFGNNVFYKKAFSQKTELFKSKYYSSIPLNSYECLLQKLSFSRRIPYSIQNNIQNLFFLRAAKELKSSFEEFETDSKPVLIVDSGFRKWEKLGFFKILKNEIPDLSIVYYFADIVAVSKDKQDICQNKNDSIVDLIATYDLEDAKRYHLLYQVVPFDGSTIEKYCESNIKYDVSFVGKAKDRLDVIVKVFSFLIQRGYKCEFYIVGVDKGNQVLADKIHYCEAVSYDEYLEIESHSRCLLEILQKDCSGFTFRVPEAVFMSRILLTNNTTMNNDIWTETNNVLIINDLDKLSLSRIKSTKINQYPENIKQMFSLDIFLKTISENLE